MKIIIETAHDTFVHDNGLTHEDGLTPDRLIDETTLTEAVDMALGLLSAAYVDCSESQEFRAIRDRLVGE